MSERVLVTGVAGFIGSHVARVALLAGLAVRGTVRGNSYGVEKAVPGVEVVQMDLLNVTEADLAAAMSGCNYLAHVASPFPGTDVTEEEMKVAVEGTAKVLRAAAAANVKRILLTSSVAAIGGSADKTKGTAARPYTGADWSPDAMTASYSVSKTQAEKGAWTLAEELGLDMTTIHPSFVNGPMLLARAPTSTAMAKRILEGDMPVRTRRHRLESDHSYPTTRIRPPSHSYLTPVPTHSPLTWRRDSCDAQAVPAIGMNVCGVNDVAEAHVKALLNPSTKGQRLIVASGNLLMTDLAVAIQVAHGADGWPIRTLPIPWVGMWLYSFFDKQAASVLPLWKKESHYDVAATEKLLGRALQPPMEAALEMAASIVELGVATRPGSKAKAPGYPKAEM